MSKGRDIDTALNEIAGETVAHPASRRRFLWLSPAQCDHALKKAEAIFGVARLVVMRRTLFRRHCGQGMAVVRQSLCPCGREGLSDYRILVCLCPHCGRTE